MDMARSGNPTLLLLDSTKVGVIQSPALQVQQGLSAEGNSNTGNLFSLIPSLEFDRQEVDMMATIGGIPDVQQTDL
jgi:hypothetical protein